jgi:hypothetical protein
MLIEFFGLPGTGKSTMSRVVVDLVLKRGLVVDEITYDLDHRRPPIERLLAKIAHLARYFAAHPCRGLSDLVRIAATRQATLLDLAKSIFNWMFIASIAAQKRSPHRIVILDQGVAQAMWSIGFAAQDEKSLEKLVTEARGAAPRPDLIVHVRAKWQTIGDRLATRERCVSRLDALGQDHKALQRAEMHGDMIMRMLRSSGIPVIEVENDDRTQLISGARLVAGAILTRLNEQRIALGGPLRPDTAPLAKPADRSLTDDRPIEGQSPSQAEVRS